MDYFFLFCKMCGGLIVLFHSALFLLHRDIVDLLYICAIIVSAPAIVATEYIRNTRWYCYLGLIATWFGCLGVTLSMTKEPDDIVFEPVILPWLGCLFCLMNCTERWYGATTSLTLALSFNLSMCYMTYGITLNVQKTAFVYFVLIVMHATFSMREEVHYREAFYTDRCITTLKESFEGTIEALPAPLLVKRGEDTAFANEAFRKQFSDEDVQKKLFKALKEREEAIEEEHDVTQKLNLGNERFWHTQKPIVWNNRESRMHLFVNVTAEHELTLQKAANRYMKIMIGSITHELRTPLNSSTNALELLEGRVPPDCMRHLKTAKTSNRLLSALIEDILDLTRIESGQFELNKSRFRVKALVELLDELFRF